MTEDILAVRDSDPYWLSAVPEFLAGHTGLAWCFITEIYQGDSRHYFVRGAFPDPGALSVSHSVDGGLAGWVHSHQQPLSLNSLNTQENITFIFSKSEPIKKPSSFYGWPLVYQDALMGGLFLVGAGGQTLDAELLGLFPPLTARLAAHAFHMRLLDRVTELKGLDPQTGLPHRTNFLDRLERLLSLMSVQKSRLTLKLISVSGLGRYSLTHSLDDTQMLLRTIASQLLHYATESWELGHVSYGLFAIAVPEEELPELDKSTRVLKKILNEWSSSAARSQKSFIFHEQEVRFPDDGSKAEELLENALTRLAKA
jgi:GGDEF domain-containing protein